MTSGARGKFFRVAEDARAHPGEAGGPSGDVIHPGSQLILDRRRQQIAEELRRRHVLPGGLAPGPPAPSLRDRGRRGGQGRDTVAGGGRLLRDSAGGMQQGQDPGRHPDRGRAADLVHQGEAKTSAYTLHH